MGQLSVFGRSSSVVGAGISVFCQRPRADDQPGDALTGQGLDFAGRHAGLSPAGVFQCCRVAACINGGRAPGEGAPSLTSLLADQRSRWQRGERIPIEAYLLRHPALTADGDGILDLIGNEIVLRLELGETPSLAEYVRRFPQWSAQM